MTRPALHRRNLCVLVAFGIVCGICSALAQGGRSDDNVLYPQPVLPLYIGPEAGYAMWDIDASFIVGDGALKCATFAGGSGSGPTIGVRALLYVSSWLFLSPRLRYGTREMVFVTPLDPQPARDSRDSIVMLTSEGQVDAKLSTATFDIRIGIDLFASGVYFTVGPSSSLVVSNTYDFTERITGPADFVHSSSREVESLLLTGKRFDNENAFVVDAHVGAGMLANIGSFAINPEVSYTFPITSYLAPPDMMKHRGFSGALAVLYNFGATR